ncbi:hypothetical protein [Candidatus Villigracilis saccharophilus]|uniref:GAF domain-containing protein n=1 Tax=Candidatus Villigracilis saccharophilus TaxID=3140684 RepID=UPI0031370EBE|nr:GAF domain-containing protein [Anaerolineales bacterium]
MEITDVWRRILNQTMQALQVETVALALIDHDSNDLIFQAAAGHNSGSIPGRHIHNGHGLTGQVITNGLGLIVPSVKQDSHYVKWTSSRASRCGLSPSPRSSHRGRSSGVLEAVNPISAHLSGMRWWCWRGWEVWRAQPSRMPNI